MPAEKIDVQRLAKAAKLVGETSVACLATEQRINTALTEFTRLVIEECAKVCEILEPRIKYGDHQYVCGHMESKHQAADAIRRMKP